ncbi:MAG TPA: pyruvate dehydrogenase (acetyl-transferring), homodimeric type [Acidobacteriota bacterium]|nr:pyruvate dehydrogenase (acetyl-transferring), homodimeric type [Acidobacteriota bacterium]
MITDFKQQLPDIDPPESQEWIESLDSVVREKGKARAQFLIRRLLKRSRMLNLGVPELVQTPYINTISPEQEPSFPGDEQLEKRIRRMIRWNAVVMVTRANKHFDGIGGHISTYASSASLYEVGFNHFFRGKDDGHVGDQVFFQGHASPGIYARAFLEGRLTQDQMDHFRRECVPGQGLSSYPHPRLMPDFWEFPTVSMGIGPLNALYQARFNRYLQARGIANTENSRVWAFVGDGECDEPEALGSLFLASRERLDNLIFVVSCNLQRLDGPVRGNGKIIQELEMVFRGAGWNVIKVIWGREWDALLRQDVSGVLLQKMNETVDGAYQKYATAKGDYIREHFFGPDPRLRKMVEHLSDQDLQNLRRGGHDYRKLYASYKLATEHKGSPTVILAKTVKGWALGEGFLGKNVTHQLKKMNLNQLKEFRDRLELPISDRQLEEAPYYHPGPNSPEIQYMIERRRALGGFLPRRVVHCKPLRLPAPGLYDEFKQGTGTGREVSTTMAFVRLLRQLLRDKDIGRRIVPIIPDEARTFGMDSLFREVGIYSTVGQLYESVDAGLLINYHESKDGQILEEGITEAGSIASFTAAGTSYATHGEIMIPFYIFYSMFGFQRTGDLFWAFGDVRGRGFALGATAGRTTLNGEGLQHEDGHSHVLATTIPNVLAYDPAFAFEVAMIVKDGLYRMNEKLEDIFYYITLYNENIAHPPMPEGTEEGIIKGLYLFKPATQRLAHHVQLFGSGSIMQTVLKAQAMLAERFEISADVWSATSYQQLRDEALCADRWTRLHPEAEPRVPYVVDVLEGIKGPIVAATDYMKTVPDLIRPWVSQRYVSLGTDGFGRSDTREALRRHFEVDAENICIAALYALCQEGRITPAGVSAAIRMLGVDPEKLDPIHPNLAGRKATPVEVGSVEVTGA